MDLEGKKRIREQMAARRAALDFQWLETASAKVRDALCALERFQSSETVALYKALPGEVDLEPLFSRCWKAGRRTCIPVFNPASKLYEMAEVSAETRYRIGRYGIREPESFAPASLDGVGLMVVPGVAFDRRGGRLGRGGGYYDRLLDGFSGFPVGVAFHFQILSQVPREPHDWPVAALVTERGRVDLQNER